MVAMEPSLAVPTQDGAAVRVLVVDDSAIIRGFIARALQEKPGFEIAGSAGNGEIAIDMLRRHPADVVILDVEMPVMDGLAAIPKLKEIDPAVQIVMASTLTQKNAEISLKALALGATDYIPKPAAADMQAAAFNRDLRDKVGALGAIARRRGVRPPPGTSAAAPKPAAPKQKTIVLRPMPNLRPAVIAIGSSTGGPQALFEVVKAMGGDLPQPVVIAQHMPPSFTAILADHIARQCGVACAEAKQGESLKPGRYYVAPGDYHMTVAHKAAPLLHLAQDPPENFCRPAVDPLLRSLADIYGNNVLAVILTGMGQDGCKGAAIVAAAGGAVIAQDEATSVVWGMPGAAAMAGLCSAVLPLGEIGAMVRGIATKGRA